MGMAVAVGSRRRGGRPLGLAQAAAWVALVAVAGLAVRAEVRPPDSPAGVVAYTDLVYRRVGGRRAALDVYMPRGPIPAGGRPAVVAIHGGGWCGGSKEGFGRGVARLARHGLVVVSVEYKLARPGVGAWPENLDDVREAVRWVRRHARDYGIDADRIAALGASAGGHLAALVGTVAEEDGADVSARVSAVVSLYGPSDLPTLVREGPGAAEPVALLLGPAPAPGAAAAASPLRHVTADDPPMLLIHGADDRLVPPGQSERLGRALEAAGVRGRVVVVAGAGHNFGLRRGRRDFLPEILAFLDGAWHHRPEAPRAPGDRPRRDAPPRPSPGSPGPSFDLVLEESARLSR